MDEQAVHEPQMPIVETEMASPSRALKRKEADVREAEQSLDGAKRWQEEAIREMAAAKAGLAVLREEHKRCAEQYQQAALEAADLLEAEESQRVQGLLAPCQEVLEEGARSDAGKTVQAAAGAVEVMDEGADDAAGAGASGRVKRQRGEEGDGQPDVGDLDAEQVGGAAGRRLELLAELPPGAMGVMAHPIEQCCSPQGSGQLPGPWGH